MASFASTRHAVFDRVQRAQHYHATLSGLTAFERHKRLLADHLSYAGSQPPQSSASDAALAALAGTRTDADVLRDGFRFIRSADDDAADTWEVRLARRYYDRLFKEFCIADLSRYKEGAVGMRWRTEQEVVSGKGQFVCGARGCDATQALASYEVSFAYVEAGQSKHALVKLRLCPACAAKLTYQRSRARQGAAATLQQQQQQQQQQQPGSSSSSGASSDSDEQGGGKRRRVGDPQGPWREAVVAGQGQGQHKRGSSGSQRQPCSKRTRRDPEAASSPGAGARARGGRKRSAGSASTAQLSTRARRDERGGSTAAPGADASLPGGRRQRSSPSPDPPAKRRSGGASQASAGGAVQLTDADIDAFLNELLA